jgi:RNA polymerase sigma-70 factor, ECF subfamily
LDLEEPELIEMVKQGDAAAFEPIVRKYQQKLYTYCYFMLGQRQEAEDAVQDILFKAYRYINTYRKSGTFLSWLYAVANNHCKTLLKRKMRRGLLMRLMRAESKQIGEDPEYRELAQNETASLLVGLSQPEKELLLFRAVQEQSFEQIGQIVGEKPATLRKRFERLRKKIILNKQQKEELENGRYQPEF